MNEMETAIIDREMPSKVSQADVAAALLQHGSSGPGFDPEALRAKYLREKEKRLNNGGTKQYRLVDELSEYAHDIWAESELVRAPVTALYDVVIVGGGFTALQVACRLLEHGYDNIAMIERGADFGGTWYFNRYPGAQCDIESYIYMPLVEELGTMPTEKYAKGPELYNHARAIAHKYNLYQYAHLQTTVESIRWNDTECVWAIATDKNDDIKARWVVNAPGPLQGAKFPGVPGIKDFKGKSFHTSRWDYDYTGGSPEQPDLTHLADKRVVGTGATGIQTIPFLAKWAKSLYVFQRTPSSIDERNNKPTDYTWAKTLKPGWQRHRMENFSSVTSGLNVDEDLVSDGWTFIFRALNGGPTHPLDPTGVATRLQLADYKKMEAIRARVDNVVKNSDVAEALKPWYNQWCKRPCFNDEYLDAFNRPNVHLVHTEGKGIERLTEKGIVVAGQETELDCVVYATGFEFNNLDFSRSKMSMDIVGRNDMVLTEKWKDGAVTLHGWASHDFPNFMIISPLQAGGNPNYTHNASEMAMHLVYLMDSVKKLGIKSIEPTLQAEQSWVEAVVETQGARGDFLMDCTPGYYNDEGNVNGVTLKNQPYGAGPLAYINILRAWRKEDKLEGMTIRYEQGKAP